ncbi:hypothetical protein B0T14DRAFT_276035 [Immersiella caudata]|uniref:C2H2-type domain-containing protein n=1 Tax=Immersiella caudata TaxID=314043 RepID=A0AA40BTP8_9PEZI|nr:hypothetical protein B0T14DRAFT_276035 [Immersiella caudata]
MRRFLQYQKKATVSPDHGDEVTDFPYDSLYRRDDVNYEGHRRGDSTRKRREVTLKRTKRDPDDEEPLASTEKSLPTTHPLLSHSRPPPSPTPQSQVRTPFHKSAKSAKPSPQATHENVVNPAQVSTRGSSATHVAPLVGTHDRVITLNDQQEPGAINSNDCGPGQPLPLPGTIPLWDAHGSAQTPSSAQERASSVTTSDEDSDISDFSWASGTAASSPFLSTESRCIEAIVGAYKRPGTSLICEGSCAAAEPELGGAPASSQKTDTSSKSTNSLAISDTSPCQTGSTSQWSSQSGDKVRGRGREDDEDGPKQRRAPKRKRIPEGGKRLACPFQKRYPLKHFFCGMGGANRGFDIIAHLKEHIWRCHVQPRVYCPRCKAKFDDSQNLADHILEFMATESCEERDFRDDTALPWSQSLATSLKARVNKLSTLHEQWISVWNILFPGVDPPDSCLVDDDTCEHILEYQQFIMSRGYEIVTDVVRASGLLSNVDTEADEPELIQQTAAELEEFAQRIFGLAAEVIFRTWVDGRGDGQTGHQTASESIRGNDSPGNKGKENVAESSEDASSSSNRTSQRDDPMPAQSTAPSPLKSAAEPPVIMNQAFLATHPGVGAGGGINEGEGAGTLQDQRLGEGSTIHDFCLDNYLCPDCWSFSLEPGANMPSNDASMG